MKKLIRRLSIKIGQFWEGVSSVMAMLMAVRIVENKYDYKRVPRLLKAQVDECLESLGFKVVDGQLVALDVE